MNDMSEKALDLFETLPLKLNEYLYAIIYDACASSSTERAMDLGKILLNEMSKNYLDDAIVINSIMNMLMKFGDLVGVERVFQSMKNKSIVIYGTMMKGNGNRSTQSLRSVSDCRIYSE